LRKKNQTQVRPMLFFLITLRYMTGISYCSERYRDVIAKADESTKKDLETLSKKLSRHASGYLKSSLEHFNFSSLEGTFPGTDFSDFPFPDSNDDDDDDDYEDEMDDLDEIDDVADMLNEFLPFLNEIGQGMSKKDVLQMVENVEGLVDELDIRGLPEGEIREIRNHIRSIPPIKKILDSMVEILKFADSKGLSREAKILLSGKNPKRKQLSLF
jgi:hypothetical protein